MQASIKFNVIIPTRERPDTLFHCLRTVVAQDYENLEIIVSDNFSQDSTEDVVRSFHDSRIRYINTGKRISMSHNYEFALNHVKGGWVTFLGDDDGMLPGGLKRIDQVVKDSGCQAVTSMDCSYFWPNAAVYMNRLSIPLDDKVELRESKKWLAKVMRGDANYWELPWLYVGGFADLGLINKARDHYGRFFLSMTPDVYSAIALASISDSYVVLSKPVCVLGMSAHSSGTSAFGFGNKNPAQKFYSEDNIPFHANIGSSGQVKSIPILVYECYLQAMHLHNDFLRIDMKDQLALALAVAMPQHYFEIHNYCAETARLNSIDISKIEKSKRVLKWHLWLQRTNIVGKLGKYWQNMFVDALDFNVTDVYEATFLANAIIVFHNKYRNWQWDRLVNLLKRITCFICRK